MTDPTAKPRWYRLTPDRAVVAVLALEGFLLLSAWFRWFPFNQYKGWTVLICLATVGAAFVLMSLWFLAALLFCWRFQFSILSLLLLVVVVAIPCSWLETEMKAARKQREAVEEVQKASQVVFDHELGPDGRWIAGATPPGPPWLRNLLGDDLFTDAVWVSSPNAQINDAVLAHLEELTALQGLDLDHARITDAGLRHIEGLSQLQQLSLTDPRVGDAGMVHLGGLRQLRVLHLDCTDVGDAGMKCLKGLTQLREPVAPTIPGSGTPDFDYLRGLTRLQGTWHL